MWYVLQFCFLLMHFNLTVLAQYSNTSAVVFEQYWPLGANGTQVQAPPGGTNYVVSTFPSFHVAAVPGVPLGFFGYNGQMVGENQQAGIVHLY